ncbi:MAG: type II secretion system protein [Holophagales bacterium]|nr:type II secretion system protein [Holophagales bacterium]
MVNGTGPRQGRGGYTLVALLVGITVASVLIAAVLPLASAQAQREREAELIFRGLQYAEGIRVFRRRYGRYPNALQELLDVKPRSIRKLWKDPMTKDGAWGTISMAGTPVTSGGGTGSGLSPRATPTPRPTPTPGPFAGTALPGAGGAAAGPVMGVYSKSTESGYRLWEGRESYNEWRFTEESLALKPGDGGSSTGPGPGFGGTGPAPPGGGRN